MKLTELKDLKLRQKVRLGGNFIYSDCTVVQITETTVKLARPYIVTGDTEYTAGVSHSTGVEVFEVPKTNPPILAEPLSKWEEADALFRLHRSTEDALSRLTNAVLGGDPNQVTEAVRRADEVLKVHRNG